MREMLFFGSSLHGFGRTVGAFVLLLGVAFAMPAKATPIGLVLDDAPDIFSAFITVDYTASTDALTADGFASTIDLGGGQQPITSGTFDLDAEIDGLGGLVSGTISIGGTVASLGFNSGTLLTDGAGETFEFLFDVTGGDAAGDYGSEGGILLSGTGFGGSFGSDFGDTNAVSDTAPPVPEPGLAVLLVPVMIGLFKLSGERRSH
jgi:hypothetical protein